MESCARREPATRPSHPVRWSSALADRPRFLVRLPSISSFLFPISSLLSPISSTYLPQIPSCLSPISPLASPSPVLGHPLTDVTNNRNFLCPKGCGYHFTIRRLSNAQSCFMAIIIVTCFYLFFSQYPSSP